MFKRANTFDVLDPAVTAIGYEQINKLIVYSMCVKYFTIMLVTRYEIPAPVMYAVQELSFESSGIQYEFFSSRKGKNASLFVFSYVTCRNALTVHEFIRR